LTEAAESKLPISQASLPLVRRLFQGYIRKQAGRLAFALATMAVTAATTAAIAKLMEPILDDVFQARDPDMLWKVGLVLFIVFVAKGASTYAHTTTMNYVSQRILADLQLDMFAHLMRADLTYFHGTTTGKLISRFTYDVNLLRGAVSNGITGIGKEFLTLVFLTGVMFYQDWRLACFAFLAFPLAMWAIVKIGRKLRRVYTSTQIEWGELTTLLTETFQGARHVKAYGMEAYETKRALGSIDRVFHLIIKGGKTRSLSHPIMESMGGLAVVLVILYGGMQVIEGTNTTGTFFSFVTAVLLAYEPMKKLANLNSNLQEGLAAAQRIFRLLDLEPEIHDKEGATVLRVSEGRIEFADVHFSYKENEPALKGVSLVVEPGSTLALVGPSGAGKSTILNLIPRFYDVDSGAIRIDSQDVRDVTLASLRANIGLVSQEVTLFNDTVRANIAYGRAGATEEEIVAAAKEAAAHDFIEKLPQGYDTFVGDQGIKLSGGQRQRIAIARALLKDAPILLLDEATSSLDTKSERQVQAALARLKKGRTTLVIAHRLSTVTDADRICVIEDGCIVESGTHRELLARGGAFARLHSLQFIEEAPESLLARA
jgi:subfamily B ATP-binding cassette protein MsbA